MTRRSSPRSAWRWTSTARFNALVARRGAGGAPSKKPLAWLQENHRGTTDEVAGALGLSAADVHASLSEAAGQGLVVYDLLHGVYRHRPLLHTPLPPEVTLGGDPQEQEAKELVARKAAAIVGAPCSVGGAASALNDSRKTFSVPSIEGLAESGLRVIPALL